MGRARILQKAVFHALQVQMAVLGSFPCHTPSRPAAIHNAMSLSLRLPEQPEQALPAHTSILDAYHLAQQELLILGEPGAGKSMELLKLAQHLVEKAEQDMVQPLPVVLPLSSWATKRLSLQDWLIEQFALLYNVPRQLSHDWMQTNLILPLLDGLDEMEESARPACIATINTYHHEHFQPLVVCSRTTEYDTATLHERLALHTAIVVQPLTLAQVDALLTTIGKPLTALRTALKKNTTLQTLATTPLLLQILMLTYHGIPVGGLSHKEDQLREQIWCDYIQHMVRRKGNNQYYPLEQTRTWLGWLAQQMRWQNITIFSLEQLTLNWLPKGQRMLYQWNIGLGSGLGSGLQAALQHYLLRFWLWRSHLFLLKAVPFLEDATARNLLRRVGGGYSFTHRLLLDYFANLEMTLPAPSINAICQNV